jgi:hypothetical protein
VGNVSPVTDLLLRVSDFPIPRPSHDWVTRKNPAAPEHAIVSKDALASSFLWAVLFVVFGFIGVAIGAAVRQSPQVHSMLSRGYAGGLTFCVVGMALNVTRYERCLFVVWRRRVRSLRKAIAPEGHPHWPTRPGDLDVVIQVAIGLVVALSVH